MSMRALWLAILAIGCGGGVPTPAKEGTAVMGTLLGKPFAATNAASFSASDPMESYGVVVISTSAELCSALQAGHLPPGSRNLVLNLYEVDAQGGITTPTSAGRYTVTDALVGPAKLAGTSYVETDANCGVLASEAVIYQGGTVTLTGTESDAYSGSFSISMSSPDYASGSFQSDPCLGASLASPRPRC